MLSQRNIEKRVEEELARDERWRVIVRGNNWLCPYCLRIGARELRMDEAIEEKLALHFLGGCPNWDYFNAEPQPIDRLRQTARYLVFKQRVLRWITDDPRFRVHDEARHWICPYCAETTDAPAPGDPAWAEGPSPEESPFLGQLVNHLLQCARFAEGEDRILSARDLEEAKSRSGKKNKLQTLRKRFEREPAFRLTDAERSWLCPFCATLQDLRLEGERVDDAFVQRAAAHIDGCKAQAVLGGVPRPIDELRARLQAGARARQVERIRQKIEGHAIWRVRDVDMQWLCPYCAVVTAVHYPPKGADGQYVAAEMEKFLEQVIEHLAGCEEYRRPEARIRSRGEMAEAVQAANLHIDRHRRVRKALVENELFGVTDDVSNWLCPYCKKIQKQIHIMPSVESAQFEKTVEQVVIHLWQGCESFREDQAPRATREELEELVGQDLKRLSSSGDNVGKGTSLKVTSAAIESLDERSWQRIKDDLDEVRRRVERSKRRESSLREARQKQLRLLPDIPSIPGYEFARVYKPMEAVGGDFFCFFPAGEGLQAFAVGDITGHGIEAALLMGLAKKLLEVHGRDRTSPSRTLCLANRDIFSDLDDRTFVTVFYGLLDTETRRLRFSRAGHDPLILFNPRRQPRLSVVDCKGMALGMDEGPIFEKTLEEVEMPLLPGDLVVQYTDGVTETMNAANEQFGRDRLYKVIEEHGHHEAEYVLWKIEKATEAFRGDKRKSDDLTLVAFKVLE